MVLRHVSGLVPALIPALAPFKPSKENIKKALWVPLYESDLETGPGLIGWILLRDTKASKGHWPVDHERRPPPLGKNREKPIMIYCHDTWQWALSRVRIQREKRPNLRKLRLFTPSETRLAPLHPIPADFVWVTLQWFIRSTAWRKFHDQKTKNNLFCIQHVFIFV